MALTAAKDVYRGAFEPLPGSVYHAAYPYCYRAAGGAHDPADCTCDWEAELDLAVPPARVPRQGGRRSSSSRSSARAATSSRRPRSCRACARSPAGTGSCSSPTRSRPGSGGLARCSRSSTGTWSPTSSSWPRASRRACRCPGSVARKELHGPPPAGLARRDVRRQRGLVRGRQRDARRHRGRAAGRERPRPRDAAARRAATGLRGSGDRRRRPRPGAHGGHGVRPARRG